MAVDQELDHLLYVAIENKRLIRFDYKGKKRVAEPPDYGVQNGIASDRCGRYGRLQDT
jgi:hypothetical protein